MIAITWLLKFFSGFNILRGAVIGKILWLLAIFLIFQACWTKFTGPTTRQTITAEKVINLPDQKKSFFLGLKIWRLGLGVYVE
ncbi:MAG: hypothetical protein KAS66_13270 [Candidatus Omnitrophica bacterium]|nr:hypothetical protein [Candidatus Omnitrophota bacterium]